MGGLPSTSGDPGAGGGILELLSLGLVSRLTHPRARRRRSAQLQHTYVNVCSQGRMD
jgi:hypothetical protein